MKGCISTNTIHPSLCTPLTPSPFKHPSEPFTTQNLIPIPAGFTGGGTIGLGYKKGTPYATNQNVDGQDVPPPDWFWSGGARTRGQMDAIPERDVFGTFQQTNFILKTGTTVNALALTPVRQRSELAADQGRQRPLA